MQRKKIIHVPPFLYVCNKNNKHSSKYQMWSIWNIINEICFWLNFFFLPSFHLVWLQILILTSQQLSWHRQKKTASASWLQISFMNYLTYFTNVTYRCTNKYLTLHAYIQKHIFLSALSMHTFVRFKYP